MHRKKMKMVLLECLQMVMHLGTSNKDGQFLKKKLIILGFHWELMVSIHLDVNKKGA
jgi:hypothetical protein